MVFVKLRQAARRRIKARYFFQRRSFQPLHRFNTRIQWSRNHAPIHRTPIIQRTKWVPPQTLKRSKVYKLGFLNNNRFTGKFPNQGFVTDVFRHQKMNPQTTIGQIQTRKPITKSEKAMGFVGNINNSKTIPFQWNGRRNIMLKRRQIQNTKPLNTDSVLWRSIGMKLLDKLNPNRSRFDLFNKEYRSQIVRKYIIANGGLNHIGTNLKKADGKLLVDPEISFPSKMTNMFAISIRPTRYDNLLARLGPWAKHLTHWQGTNGELLDKNRMVREGIAVPRLKRGEIGAYDAHYRLWKHISDNNIPQALILEDDADINYGHHVVDRINKMFEELEKHGVQYDLIYLGHNNNKRPRKMIGGSLGTPAGVQGLFMYYVTLEGARKLIQGAMPITQPVDDYAYVQQPRVRQFTLEPRLGWVVPIEQSDTANIV